MINKTGALLQSKCSRTPQSTAIQNQSLAVTEQVYQPKLIIVSTNNFHLLVSLRKLDISVNSPMQFNRALISVFILYSAKHKIAILTFSTEVIHNIIKKEFKTNLSLFAV